MGRLGSDADHNHGAEAVKFLNLDGSEFRDAPDWLLGAAPAEIGRSCVGSQCVASCKSSSAADRRPEELWKTSRRPRGPC